MSRSAVHPLQMRLPIAGEAVELAPLPPPRVPEQALAGLHRRLGRLLGEPISVVGTDNRRSLITWRRDPSGMLHIRLQRQFAVAGDDVTEALARYLRRPSASDRTILQEAAQEFDLRPARRRGPTVRPPRGEHHDLVRVLERQNRKEFAGRFEGRIGWSSVPGRRTGRRRSIRLGSWSEEHRLIRVHPALDAAWVPAYVLEFVVFHEMLHAELGARRTGGRRQVHTPAFRRRERRHPSYDRARAWIDANLERLLRW